MGRGKWLTEIEKIQIDAFKSLGKSNRRIAKLISRSPNVINNYVKNTSYVWHQNLPGRPRKLTNCDVRRILFVASRSDEGCQKIRDEIAPHVSKVTVWRVIKTSRLGGRKKQKRPRLKGSREFNSKSTKLRRQCEHVGISSINGDV